MWVTSPGCWTGFPTGPALEHYINIVKDKALLRNLICQAEGTIKAAYEGHATGEQVLTASETAIRGLADKHALGATSGRIRTWEQIPTLKLLPSADVSWVVEGIIP